MGFIVLFHYVNADIEKIIIPSDEINSIGKYSDYDIFKIGVYESEPREIDLSVIEKIKPNLSRLIIVSPYFDPSRIPKLPNLTRLRIVSPDMFFNADPLNRFKNIEELYLSINGNEDPIILSLPKLNRIYIMGNRGDIDLSRCKKLSTMKCFGCKTVPKVPEEIMYVTLIDIFDATLPDAIYNHAISVHLELINPTSIDFYKFRDQNSITLKRFWGAFALKEERKDLLISLWLNNISEIVLDGFHVGENIKIYVGGLFGTLEIHNSVIPKLSHVTSFGEYNLVLSNCEIHDLELHSTDLSTLKLSNCKFPVSDLSKINAPNLVHFAATSCGLKTLPLPDNGKLQWLSLNDNEFTSIDQIPRYRNLKSLDISGNPIKTLKGVENLNIDQFADTKNVYPAHELKYIKSMKNLHQLDINVSIQTMGKNGVTTETRSLNLYLADILFRRLGLDKSLEEHIAVLLDDDSGYEEKEIAVNYLLNSGLSMDDLFSLPSKAAKYFTNAFRIGNVIM